MTRLERRYRLLLKAYPRPYREYRADEILEILLAGDDQKRRPSVRESWALVVGGLRERGGVHHLDARGLRRSSLRVSALAALVLGIALQTAILIPSLTTAGLPRASLASALLLTIGFIAAAWARYRVAFVATVLAATGHYVIGADAGPARLAIDARFWSPLVAALILAALLRAAPRTRVAKLWLWPALGLPAAVALAWSPRSLIVALCVFAALAILAAPIDARASVFALALLLPPALALTAAHVLTLTGESLTVPLPATVMLAAGLVAASTAGLAASRRQIRR